MSFDKETGRAIATLMHLLRPEWDAPGCLAAVAKVAGMEPMNVAMAAIRLCATPEAKTPGALSNRDGQHWREKLTASQVRYPPKRGEDCKQHPGEWPDTCRGCASERLAPIHEIRPDATPMSALDVRAQLRLATSGLCSHGVTPEHCLQLHPTEPEEAEA